MDTSSTKAPAAAPGRRRQRGSIVLYLAVALVAFGVLSMAGASRFGSSVISVFSPNCATQARLMAESGMRYAMARLRAAANQAALDAARTAMHDKTFTVDAARGLAFSLRIGYDGAGSLQVNATGQACSSNLFVGSPQASLSVNVPAIGPQPPTSGGGTDPGEVPNSGFGGGGWSTTSGFSGAAGATINASAGTLNLGNSLYSNSASAWYTGTSGVCTGGNCTLGSGMCAYFEGAFSAGSSGDGFVWTLMSGDTNTRNSNGGDTGRGELLGYGGLGASGLGIKPPKLGVEFDIWESDCNSICSVSSRCDANSRDHIAHIFWGSQTVSGCDASYDDNRHGAGSNSTSEPKNSDNDDTSSGYDGYYYRTTSDGWLKNGGTFYYRYELDRSTTPNASGNYCYQIRSWLKKSGDTYPAGLSNCTIPYTGPPDITSVVNLSPAMHQKLAGVIPGFTEGTGGATQLATLRNFTMYFKSAPTVPVVPQDYRAGWSFYEASGTTAHDMNATNRNDGTLRNTVQWVPGIGCPNCPALRFSNNSDRVEVPDSASLDLTTTGSIAAWVNIQSERDYAGLVHKGEDPDQSDEAYSLQFTTNRKVALYIRQDAATVRSVESAAGLPNNDQWYHVAATWDAANLKIYVNGVLSSTATNTGAIAARNSAGGLTLGAQFWTTGGWGGWGGSGRYPFRGLLDEIYLYNRVLTATEITNMALGHP